MKNKRYFTAPEAAAYWYGLEPLWDFFALNKEFHTYDPESDAYKVQQKFYDLAEAIKTEQIPGIERKEKTNFSATDEHTYTDWDHIPIPLDKWITYANSIGEKPLFLFPDEKFKQAVTGIPASNREAKKSETADRDHKIQETANRLYRESGDTLTKSQIILAMKKLPEFDDVFEDLSDETIDRIFNLPKT